MSPFDSIDRKAYTFLNLQTMENVRKYRWLKLIHNEARLLKVSAKASYKTSKICYEDLVAAEMYRANVKLFKSVDC